MSHGGLANAANLATTVAAVVGAVTLAIGLYEFSRTEALAHRNLDLQLAALEQEREIKAVELFARFNEAEEALALKPPPKKGEAGYYRYNLILSLTEETFRLTEGDAGWRETVRWMVSVQRAFITTLNCKTFDAHFVELVHEVVPEMVCD